MRVLGIDPGLTRCGLGVVDGSVGRPLSLVDVNVLRTSADRPVPERLVTILSGIEAWLDEFQPDAVAVERVFARSDSSTIMGTAQASGIAMVCAARRGLPIALHTPSEVKAAVSGQRSRRQGPGRCHGHPDPGAVGPAEARRRRRRAGAGHHPHLARRGTGPHRRRAGPTRERFMIAFVRGEVAEVTLSSAVLAVGGVGLELQCTPGTLATLRVGQQATLPTSMVVREESLTLFGFLDDDEKSVFELVQTASGVGPEAGPVAPRRPAARRAAHSGRPRGRQDPDPGARHRPEGRSTHHPRPQGPARGSARRRTLLRVSRARGRLACPGPPGSRRARLGRQGRRPGSRGRRCRPGGR